MICLGIIWNTVYPLKDEILQDIANTSDLRIIENFDLDLQHEHEKFVRGVYELDSIAKWKVDKKVETMEQSTTGRKVSIVILDITNNVKEYHPLKKRIVYTNIESLKTSIRKKYSEKVNVYFFDNVFHMTDDEKEFNLTYEYLINYFKTSQVLNNDENVADELKKSIVRVREEKKYE